MPKGNFSIDFTATMIGTDVAEVGDCLVCNSALGYYQVATDTNRASAGAGTQAIALGANAAGIGGIPYQNAGVLDAEVSGLGTITPAGTNKLVRTSTTGRLERIDAYTTGDDVVGYAYSDGRVALHIGIPWQMIAAAGAIPQGPTKAIQFNNSGAFGGASHASISSDGNTEHGADRSGGAATTGDDRFASGGSQFVRSGLVSANLCVWSHSARIGLSGFPDTDKIGGGDFTNLGEWTQGAKYAWRAEVGTNGSSPAAGIAIYADGVVTTAPTIRMVHAWYNLLLGAPNRFGSTMTDPFKGGRGFFMLDTWDEAPSAAPDFGCWFRANTANNHPEVLLPGDNVTTGWRDLLAVGSSGPAKQQTIDISSGGTIAVDLTSGRILKFVGTHDGDVAITITPNATTDALGDSFRVRNTTTSQINISNGTGASTAHLAAGGHGYLETTPDGITGVWHNSAGTIGEVLT